MESTENSREQEQRVTSQDKIETKKSKKVEWWKTQRAQRVGFVFVVLCFCGLLIWWFVFRSYVATDDARIAMPLVKLAPIQVGGRIEKVNIDEGSHVKAGDILVEIDHRIPQANYDKAKTKADLYAQELLRVQKLAYEGSTTPQALDQARSNAATAQAELKLAEVALENTFLKSPFDGVVVQKLAEVGNILEPNQTAVVVANEQGAWVAANIEETAIGKVKVGQPVSIFVDEGGRLEGIIQAVRSSVASQFALIPSDSGSGNFTKVVQRIPIKISITQRNNLSLRAGQSVEIKIKIH